MSSHPTNPGRSADRPDSVAAVATASSSTAASSTTPAGDTAANHEFGAAPRWLGKRVGRYKLISLLGKGAYGRVFLADDTDLQRRVALKVITADATARSVKTGAAEAGGAAVDSRTAADAVKHAVERMINEARAAARIEHPGVVQIYEIGKLEGAGLGGFIAMELLDGGTLQDLVDASGPMDAPRACALIADAAEALHYAHELGVIHRDVKPANLMLSRHGRCKIADFGLAYIDDPADGHHWAAAAGTALYLSPEVVLGHPADAKSDQYALAASLFTLLAGRPPYVGDRRSVLEAHVHAPPPDLRPVRPDLDARLGEVVARAMSKDPTKRFPTTRQLGKALRLFTVAVPTAANTTTMQSSDVQAPVGAAVIGSGSFEAASAAAAARRAAAQASASASGSASASFAAELPQAVAAAPIEGAPARSKVAARAAARRQRKPSVAPLIAAGVVALLLLGGAIVWASGAFRDGTPTTPAPTLAAENTPESAPPDRPAVQRSLPPAQNPIPAAATVGNPPRDDAARQPQPTKPTIAPADRAGSRRVVAPSTSPDDRNANQPAPPPATRSVGASDRPTAVPPRAPLPADPSTLPAPAGGGGGAIAATEFDRLVKIARGEDPDHGDRRAVVTGKVSYARLSQSGKVFRIRFEGTGRDRSFLAAYFPGDDGNLSKAMEDRFGGAAGAGLLGKTIRVTGVVKMYQDEPQIVVESPDQIEIQDAK